MTSKAEVDMVRRSKLTACKTSLMNSKKWFICLAILCFILLSNNVFAAVQTDPSVQKKKVAAHEIKNKTQKKNSRPSSKNLAKNRSSKPKSSKKIIAKRKSKPDTKKYLAPAPLANRAQVQAHRINLVASIPQKLVHFVQNTVNNLRYSAYKLGGTHFDTAKGIYVVDCSSYVDRVLQTVHPRAFSKLVHYSGSLKPTTQDYYQFFNNLTDKAQHYWDTIDDVSKLRPGDLLVFRYRNEPENVTKGHIVIVMEKPTRIKDTYRVRIADSAPVRHSQDTRLPRVSGIGIGTMLLKVNPKTYRPFAYAWGINSRWERNVRFAMARPIELHS